MVFKRPCFDCTAVCDSWWDDVSLYAHMASGLPWDREGVHLTEARSITEPPLDSEKHMCSEILPGSLGLKWSSFRRWHVSSTAMTISCRLQ